MNEYVLKWVREHVEVMVASDDETAVARLAILLAEESRLDPDGRTLDRSVAKVLPLDPWSRKVAGA